MRRFNWYEVSGEKTCLACECLGEHSVLKRTLKLLEGNDAAVKFLCESCGFVAVGVVSVDGSEPEPVRRAAKPAVNCPAIQDPFEDFPKPVDETPYVEPKSDKEALERAFGEMISGEELRSIVENGYPGDVTAGDWRAERRIHVTDLEMGEEKITEVLVEFVHEGTLVFSRKHSTVEGKPDIESEKKALRESCMDAIRPRSAAPAPAPARAPRGPVAIQPMGYSGIPLVDNNRPDTGDDNVRASLLRSFQGGS